MSRSVSHAVTTSHAASATSLLATQQPGGLLQIAIPSGEEEAPGRWRPPQATEYDPDVAAKHKTLQKDPKGLFFNCRTMSDVSFRVGDHDVPAHRFVLSLESPVLLQQLSEETNRLPAGFMGAPGVVLSAIDVEPSAIFEFLRFLYTSSAEVTIANVVPLVLLADEYQVDRLTVMCLEFLDKQIVPASALSVLMAVDMILLHAMLCFWKGHFFRERAASRLKKRQLGMKQSGLKQPSTDHNSSLASLGPASTRQSRLFNSTFDAGEEGVSASQSAKLWEQLLHKTACWVSMLADLREGSWSCIQEDTDGILASRAMEDVQVRYLREILSIAFCNCTEVVLFHATCEWARRACARLGLPPISTNMLEVLGEGTLKAIRFLAMPVEAIQWEVVPSGLLDHETVQMILRELMKSPENRMLDVTPRDNIRSVRAVLRQAVTIRQSALSEQEKVQMRNALRADLGMMLVEAPSERRSSIGSIEQGRTSPGGVSKLNLTGPQAEGVGDAVDSVLRASLLRAHLVRQPRPLREPVITTGPTAGSLFDASAQSHSILSQLPSANISAPPPPPKPAPVTPRRRAAAAAPPGAAPSFGRRRSALAEAAVSFLAAATPAADNPRSLRPEECVRLAPGIYRFWEDLLVEAWLEEGEIMVQEYGRNPLVKEPVSNELRLCREEAASVRKILGLPSMPPSGRGTTLMGLLQQ